MKRSVTESAPNETRFPFDSLHLELQLQIVAHLHKPKDLHAICSVLLRRHHATFLFDVGKQHSNGEVHRFLLALQGVVRERLPYTGRDCDRLLLCHIQRLISRSIFNWEWFRSTGLTYDAFTASEIRQLVTHPLYALIVFSERPHCDRCEILFAVRSVWDKASTLNLCFECHRGMRMTKKEKRPRLDEDYVWISASYMKELCAIPASRKAEEWATERGIRNSATASGMSRDKVYYFYGDVRPHCQKRVDDGSVDFACDDECVVIFR